MESTHTHEMTPAVNTTVAPEAQADAPKTEVVAEVKVEQVEMVALSEKKAVEDKLAAKETEFTALSSANAALKTELEALQAKSSADIEAANKASAEAIAAAKTAADAELAKLTGQLTAISNQVSEYQKLVEVAIPQDMLSEAVLKAASSVVEGYDATKKVAEQSPATIAKLLKFSETVKQAAQSTNAGAVETNGKRSAKKPLPNLMFEGITIKKKKQE